MKIRSSWLLQQLDSRGYTVPAHLQAQMTAFYVVDPAHGTWMPLFETDRTFDFSPMLSLDGRGILVSHMERGGPLLEDIELATGRVRQSVHLVGHTYSSHDTMVIGFLHDTGEALVQCCSVDHAVSRLLACNFSTGKTRLVASVPSLPNPNSKFAFSRCFTIVQNHPSIAYLAFPQFSELYSTERFPLYFIAHNGDILNEMEVDHGKNYHAAPVTSCDGTYLWLPSPGYETWKDRRVERYNLQNLLQESTKNSYGLPVGSGYLKRLRLTSDDRFLFVGNLGSTYAFDQRTWSWRAFFDAPRPYVIHDFVIPFDGSWLAGPATRQTSTGNFITDLCIWKTPDSFLKRSSDK